MPARRPLTANNRPLRARIALAGALVALGALAGCVDPNENAASLYADQPVFAAPVTMPDTHRDGAAPAKAAGTDTERKTASLTPPARPKPEPKIDADPRRLMGLDRSALTALLGKPAFERKDKPAEFWRYNGESCMLDLFLYGPAKAAAKDRTVRVRHVAARGLNDSPVDVGDCLRTILRARLANDAG